MATEARELASRWEMALITELLCLLRECVPKAHKGGRFVRDGMLRVLELFCVLGVTASTIFVRDGTPRAEIGEAGDES